MEEKASMNGLRHSPQNASSNGKGVWFPKTVHRCGHLEKCPRGLILGLLITGIFLFTLTRFIIPGKNNLPFDYVAQNNNFSTEPFPKIFHQVWLNYSHGPIPDDWQKATETSRTLNPDFEYKLWSAKDVRKLLQEHHPWFLNAFNNYRYNVQRADAARYFIVHKYGGIYLDMDEFSKYPFSKIIEDSKLDKYDCLLPGGTPSGVTNYLFMCKKGSPFLAHMTSRLRYYDGWYGIPYATVMWSTGPRFVSARYAEYADKDSIYVLPNDKIEGYFGCLFGQTWFSWDGVIIHTVVYPFIRLGVSWNWGYVFLISLALIILVIVYFCCCRKTKISICDRCKV